jgi:hypothetical protein
VQTSKQAHLSISASQYTLSRHIDSTPSG